MRVHIRSLRIAHVSILILREDSDIIRSDCCVV